jgi:hypothetical protein
MLAVEALAIRFKDIDFLLILPEFMFVKNIPRLEFQEISISQMKKYLTQWLDWRCRKRDCNSTQLPNPDDLVFNVFRVKSHPQTLYVKVDAEFKSPTSCQT